MENNFYDNSFYNKDSLYFNLDYGIKNKYYENSSNSILEKNFRNSDYYLQKANFYESELSDFLILNGNLYPDYESKNNIDSSIKNKCDLNNDGLYGFMIV